MYKPNVLIMGHSFVRRFEAYLCKGGDRRVKRDLNLPRSSKISFQGIGDRTVDKLTAFDPHSVGIVNPDTVILEIGSNDLCSREVKPETVGSKIEALVHHLHARCHVKFIVICQTINRTSPLLELNERKYS